MAKKQVAVSLRKPPPPAELAALVIEASNESVAAARKSDVRELREAAPSADAFVGAVKTPQIPGKRALTVQLPESVVDRLLAYCRLHERDLNDVVAEIIAQHLAAQNPAKLSFESALRWVRERLGFVMSLRARVLQFAGI